MKEVWYTHVKKKTYQNMKSILGYLQAATHTLKSLSSVILREMTEEANNNTVTSSTKSYCLWCKIFHMCYSLSPFWTEKVA